MTKRLSLMLNLVLGVVLIAVLAVPVLAQDGDDGYPTDENDTEIEARNKALTYQLYEETNNFNDQFFFDLLAEDYYDHALGGDRDTFIALYGSFYTAFPDLQFEVTHLLADGDLVAVRGIQRGTSEGDFFGIPPTGEEVEWTGIAVFRFNEEGKIVERWQNLDEMGLMTQLGAMGGADVDG